MGKNDTHLKSTEEFQGRPWLSLEEWETYRRRAPVRYPSKLKDEIIEKCGLTCAVCKDKNVPEKDLQIAHHVPFMAGVVDWGLTPQWLDSEWNVCLAHSKTCNNEFGLDPQGVPAFLEEQGLNLRDSQPFKQGFISLVYGGDGTVIEIKYKQ